MFDGLAAGKNEGNPYGDKKAKRDRTGNQHSEPHFLSVSHPKYGVSSAELPLKTKMAIALIGCVWRCISRNVRRGFGGSFRAL